MPNEFFRASLLQPWPSFIDISNAVVTLANSDFTYDGTEKEQEVISVVLGNEVLVERTDYVVCGQYGVQSGKYTIIIYGIGKYRGIITKKWYIKKATGSITVEENDVETSIIDTVEIAVTSVVGDGEIEVSSSDDDIAIANYENGIITITPIEAGNVNINVTLKEGENYLGDSITIEVVIIGPSAILEENSPGLIQAAAKKGIGSTLWSVGDVTAPISIGAFASISSTTSIRAYIIGFDHNSGVEGDGITFQFGRKTATGSNLAFVDAAYGKSNTSAGYYFNMHNSNVIAWRSTRMRNIICSIFFDALPLEWQKVIKTITKYTDNKGMNSSSSTSANVTVTEERIFLLAEYEVFGARTNANTYEKNHQKQYSYYSSGNSKKKYKHNSSDTCVWWLRSPAIQRKFCNVDTSGTAYSGAITCSYGFAPAFVIG